VMSAASARPWLSPIVDWADARRMGEYGLASLFISCLIYVLTLSLARTTPWWRNLSGWQRIAFGADAVSLLHALIATPMGVRALETIRGEHGISLDCPGTGSLATAPSPHVLVAVCGITCGTFVFDCLLLILYPAECQTRFAAAGGSWVMWLHHIISIIVWPYCVLTSRAAVFVAWMITTEGSNVGQNAYSLAGAMGLEGKPAHLGLGIGWLLSFLCVRMLPAPMIVGSYIRLFILQDCGLAVLDRLIGLVTIPIPLLLNAVWFWEMLKGAATALGKGSNSAVKHE